MNVVMKSVYLMHTKTSISSIIPHSLAHFPYACKLFVTDFNPLLSVKKDFGE